MSKLPENLKYTKTHEWVKLESNHVLRVGITDFAQAELGDLVYVELPKTGSRYDSGEQCCVVESVKTATDLFCPVAGIISAINEDLIDKPEQINDGAFNSWIFCVKADNLAELDGLMDAKDYQQMIEE